MSKPKAITNKGIIIFKDYELLFNFLTDEEAGKVLKKLLENFDNGKLKKCKKFESEKIKNVYMYISNRINDYLEKSQKAKEVGALGGNPTLNQTLNQTLKGEDNGKDNLKEEKKKEEKGKEKEQQEEEKPKEEKRKLGEFKNVLLTDEQYFKLTDVYGANLDRAIEMLSSYIASTNKKYTNHYAVLGKHNWVYKKLTEELQKEKKPKNQGYLGKYDGFF